MRKHMYVHHDEHINLLMKKTSITKHLNKSTQSLDHALSLDHAVTSASPERMFSAAGHIMNKKRANLSPDHMEELVYLHEVWPTVREWEAVKRVRH